MELIPAETSLVVAGAWNAAILTPPWILHHAFGKPANELPMVQVFMPAAAGFIFDFPRYAIEGVTYSVRPDSLLFIPSSSDDDGLTKIENAIEKIVQVLPHTPLSGVGHNFEFRETDATPAQAEVFTRSRRDLADAMPEGWQATTAAVVSSFKNADETVHVNINRQWDGASVSFRLNFHHPVNNVEEAHKILIGNGYRRMNENLALARALIIELYGEVKR